MKRVIWLIIHVVVGTFAGLQTARNYNRGYADMHRRQLRKAFDTGARGTAAKCRRELKDAFPADGVYYVQRTDEGLIETVPVAPLTMDRML